MIDSLPSVYAKDVLFDGEVDEYTQILNAYPISHQDSIEILRWVARLKGNGLSNDMIINRLMRRGKFLI
ncbi:hypothetical protein [Paenibacillus naphthalenovorans]|uniref:Uncharacterized protein n=1 Tax=Paenibacillus naphthalenovorans TaxID=162209 RepID=A0A0U2U7M6_9BACL|nr:hypothetical protein [Paenibacillus naphthalenovorans]ALS22184.1 hypothetical protein IJ22_18100 [Paenibacillus naphthalenovorans]